MQPPQARTHQLLVDAFSAGRRIRNIRAKVLLDVAAADRSRVVLLPDKATADRLVEGRSWRLLGYFIGYDRQRQGHVHVPRFDVSRAPTTHWGPGLSETRVYGYPTSIIVSRRLRDAGPDRKTRVTVCLYGGSIVRPAGITEASDRGWVKFHRFWRCRPRIAPRTLVVFDQQFALNKAGTQRIALPVFTTSMEGSVAMPIERLRQHKSALEDLFALLRIAGREWTAWHRIEADDGATRVSYFNVQQARRRKLSGALESLIQRDEVEGFLADTYCRMRASIARNELMMASYVLAPHARYLVDSAFLATFACLESIVVRLSGGRDTAALLPRGPWRKLRRQLQRSVEAWSEEAGVPADGIRDRLCRRLPDLNRASFADLWSGFVSRRRIPVVDLWPMIATDGELDLYQLRNHLAHGHVPPPAAYPLLTRAHDHLRWTLERVVLGALDYDLGTTDVSPVRLPNRGYLSMDRMTEYRRAISSAWVGRDA